jgi:hypothetical protein
MLKRKIDKNITYIPNSPVGIGLSVGYKKFSLAGGICFDFLRNKDKGKTNIIDFQYHYYGNKFIFDLFIQNYKGFYTKGEDRVLIIYPNLRLVQYGLSGQYVFNNKRFSYRAAFNQTERQLKSAGSFQVGGGVFYNQISSDSLLIHKDRNKLEYYQLNFSGGYVYTQVIKTNFHVSLGLSAGLNLEAENPRKIKGISPSFFPRLSMGYNGKDWSLGLSFLMNGMYFTGNDKLDMLLDTGYAEIAFVKRFNFAPKFLKKIKFLNR